MGMCSVKNKKEANTKNGEPLDLGDVKFV